VSDIKKELQVVLDSIKENDSHGTFEAWGRKKKKDGIAVYILKEMAVKIE
jgi:hypothetical protein